MITTSLLSCIGFWRIFGVPRLDLLGIFKGRAFYIVLRVRSCPTTPPTRNVVKPMGSLNARSHIETELNYPVLRP